jgi:glycolate oxidase iron-sulfur subunit
MGNHELDPDGELRKLAGDCVHCGFCLPACPTYQLWGEEMDSPRGRIHLITQILDGTPGTEAAAGHLDRCLGCMACVPACPSGVRYDRLIEAAREWAEGPPARPVTAAAELAGTPALEETRGLADASAHTPAAGNRAPAQAAPATDTQEPVRARTSSAPAPTTQAASAQASSAPTAAAAGARALPGRSVRDRAIRRAIFETFPYPRRLRLLTGPLRAVQRTGADRLLGRSELIGRLAPELVAALRIAPARPRRPSGATRRTSGATGQRTGVTQSDRSPRLPDRVPAQGSRRAVVGMLTGCVQQVFFPEVNSATARILAAEGCDVIVPRGQGCCGALSLHGGRRAEAADFARRTISAFERAGVDAIVVNAAGCGSAMKEYGQLLAHDAGWAARAAALSDKVRDLSEFLAELGTVAPRHPLPLTVVYQDACHLGHAQGITRQPRELLREIPDLRLAEIGDGGTCCGSAGIYNLVQPEAAAELGARKARAVHATDAELLVSANPGCAMQIASALGDQGTPMPVAHVAQVLDASLRGLPVSALLSK